MGQLLEKGHRLSTKCSSNTCEIIQFLGGGGQGEVYKAKLANREVAIKWYFPGYLEHDTDLRERIEKLIKSGAPNNRFLWPEDLVLSTEDDTSFGYVMELRERRFKSLTDLMKRKIEPELHVLTTVGFELAFNFLQLHTMGFCYRDISFGNVFFDPSNGEVRICDNDNVDVNGTDGAIEGTPRFMAPEIVRGEATATTSTDLFSLSVLLFYLFMSSHPLEGLHESSIHSFDLPAQKQLYGLRPVFIYDPEDTSNRPDPNVHRNAIDSWPIYPSFLRELFIRAFTEGLRNPDSRIRESEWRSAMARLRDCIYYCSNCGEENFCDFETKSSNAICWSCGKNTRTPMYLQLGRHQISITRDTKIFPHHADKDSLYDFSNPVAEVSRHPTDPDRWGIKNLTQIKWTASAAGGKTLEVEPGRSIGIVPGTVINFGKTDGEIKIQ